MEEEEEADVEEEPCGASGTKGDDAEREEESLYDLVVRGVGEKDTRRQRG